MANICGQNISIIIV